MVEKKISFSEKIFIAGATGMVGSSIKRKLIEYGYGLSKNNGIIFTPTRTELNLLNFEDVNNWMKNKKPTIVILAAAKVGGIYANSSYPADFLLENLKIQTNVIEAAWRNNTKRFLFLGSSCIYPKLSKQPIKEQSLLQGPLEITNESYALAKISGIKLCQSLRIQYGFDAISLMPTNLYGPGDNYNNSNSHVLPALIRRFYEAKKKREKNVTCWGTGNPLREFLYVDDLADACIFALERWSPDALTDNRLLEKYTSWVNVGCESEIKIKDLAKKISSLMEYQGEIEWDRTKPDGTMRKKLDISILSKLGWQAKTDLNKGIIYTINQFKEELRLNKIRI